MQAQFATDTVSGDRRQPAAHSRETGRVKGASPRFQARMAGVIAWITTTSGFAALISGGLIVPSDAATTARNILAHETLFRLAVAGNLVALLYIAYTLLLYRLFKPVSGNISLLAALFSFTGCAIAAMNCVFLLAPLVILRNAQPFGAFDMEQLHALALLFLTLYAQGSNISMVLFGSYNLLIGYLIFRSTFLPRILGALLALSGFCYLINCFATILAPAFEPHLLPYILVPGAAELLLALWLVAFGVNERRWKEQAGTV